jgi:hypothetical protein
MESLDANLNPISLYNQVFRGSYLASQNDFHHILKYFITKLPYKNIFSEQNIT